jgi:hypothetical protein
MQESRSRSLPTSADFLTVEGAGATDSSSLLAIVGFLLAVVVSAIWPSGTIGHVALTCLRALRTPIARVRQEPFAGTWSGATLLRHLKGQHP